jgi:hypothetical protein
VFAGSGAAQLMHLAMILEFTEEDDPPALPVIKHQYLTKSLMYHVLACQARIGRSYEYQQVFYIVRSEHKL